MAKAKAGSAENVENAEKPKKTLLIALVALLVVGAGAGGGAFFYLKSSPASAEEAHEDKGPPVYIKLEPAVVNISNGEDAHYLQVSIDLKTYDAKVNEEVTLLMPEIRDGILTLLSGQNPDTVTQPAEREKLRQQVKAMVNRLLLAHGKEKGKEPVDGVYFTAFVMQ